MYECYGCNEKYEDEEVATACCTKAREFPDGDFSLPRKLSIKPAGKSHHCPNVTHGNKSWSVMLQPEEQCPMCDYVYRPR